MPHATFSILAYLPLYWYAGGPHDSHPYPRNALASAHLHPQIGWSHPHFAPSPPLFLNLHDTVPLYIELSGFLYPILP